MGEAAETLGWFAEQPIDPAAGLALLAEWFHIHSKTCRFADRESAVIETHLLQWADQWTGLRMQVSALRNRVEEDERKQRAIEEAIEQLRGRDTGV